MLGLYRSGRQADALEAYRGAREVLVEQLGIEPGAELHELHEAVLTHDPRIDVPPATDGRASGLEHAPSLELRVSPSRFGAHDARSAGRLAVGRGDCLSAAAALLASMAVWWRVRAPLTLMSSSRGIAA
jgi:hypothetical protein